MKKISGYSKQGPSNMAGVTAGNQTLTNRYFMFKRKKFNFMSGGCFILKVLEVKFQGWRGGGLGLETKAYIWGCPIYLAKDNKILHIS